MSENTLQNTFQKMMENQAKHSELRLKRNSTCTLISGWGELFSKWEN